MELQAVAVSVVQVLCAPCAMRDRHSLLAILIGTPGTWAIKTVRRSGRTGLPPGTRTDDEAATLAELFGPDTDPPSRTAFAPDKGRPGRGVALPCRACDAVPAVKRRDLYARADRALAAGASGFEV